VPQTKKDKASMGENKTTTTKQTNKQTKKKQDKTKSCTFY